MKIADLDPLLHGLFFERFLNPERMSMPESVVPSAVTGWTTAGL
jgi:hypothetical protein